jgi:hypothetical protein
MARKIREFPCYLTQWDWKALFDGQPWLVERGEYEGLKDRSFQVYIRTAARLHGVRVKTRSTREGMAIQRTRVR